jgi:hypothetical protein
MRAKSRKCADAEAVTPPPPDVAGSRAVRRLPGVPPAAARTGARKTGRGRFERAARVAVPSAPGSIRDESKNVRIVLIEGNARVATGDGWIDRGDVFVVTPAVSENG